MTPPVINAEPTGLQRRRHNHKVVIDAIAIGRKCRRNKYPPKRPHIYRPGKSVQTSFGTSGYEVNPKEPFRPKGISIGRTARKGIGSYDPLEGGAPLRTVYEHDGLSQLYGVGGIHPKVSLRRIIVKE
jgi:hypothetical protein